MYEQGQKHFNCCIHFRKDSIRKCFLSATRYVNCKKILGIAYFCKKKHYITSVNNNFLLQRLFKKTFMYFKYGIGQCALKKTNYANVYFSVKFRLFLYGQCNPSFKDGWYANGEFRPVTVQYPRAQPISSSPHFHCFVHDFVVCGWIKSYIASANQYTALNIT